MATAAAIDRLVHHAVVLEFDVTSQPYGPVAAESAGGTRAPWPDSRTTIAPGPPAVDVVNAGSVRDPRPCGW